MRCTTVFVSVVTLCLALTCSTALAGSRGESTYDPLLHSDLIIRGKVMCREYETISRGDWYPTDDLDTAKQPLMVGFNAVEVNEVLKGNEPGDHIIVAEWPTASVIEGEEQIICLQFNPHLRGGTYFVKVRAGVFVRSNGFWERISDGRRFTEAEIAGRIDTGKIRNVIRESDVILTGTVVSCQLERNDPRCDAPNSILHCELRVDSILKGRITEGNIEFLIIVRGCEPREWRSYAPAKMEPRERLYVFLKKSDMGYYPFAGSNGLFRIEGDKLIYNNRVEFSHTKMSVDKLVAEEVNNEH